MTTETESEATVAAASTPTKATAARRKAATGSTRRAAAAKDAPAEAAGSEKIGPIELEHAGDTVRYSKWKFPAEFDGKVVGNVYAPLGAKRVAVVVQL